MSRDIGNRDGWRCRAIPTPSPAGTPPSAGSAPLAGSATAAATAAVGAALIAGAGSLFGAGGLDAQVSGARSATTTMSPGNAWVPFGPGERLEYNVKFGFLSVGEGSMEVLPLDTIRGHPAYHVIWNLNGGIPFARIDDEFQSWIDVRDFYSHRFVQDISEAGYERYRWYDFYPERMQVHQLDTGERLDLPSVDPLDDIAFIYYVRTLPLRPGEVYEFTRYFKDSGNPVIIKVLRREEVEVPAGKFQTVVVQPIIKTRGMFSEGGEAELYFTDDERRMLVMLRSKMSVGSISLHLKQAVPGTRIPGLGQRADAGPPGPTGPPG